MGSPQLRTAGVVRSSVSRVDRIMVVCSRNTFASPLLAALLQQQVHRAGLAPVRFVSAGVALEDRHWEQVWGRTLAVRYGVDIYDHLPRPLRTEDVAASCAVLGLNASVCESAVHTRPCLADVTFTLREFTRLLVAMGSTALAPMRSWRDVVGAASMERRRTGFALLPDDDIVEPDGQGEDEWRGFEWRAITSVIEAVTAATPVVAAGSGPRVGLRAS